MKNKTVSIPVGMLTRKFYCHHCGERLIRASKTRLVRPGDPDYRQQRHMGDNLYAMGEIEVTEFDFSCPACNARIDYGVQCAIAYMQKQIGEHRLAQSQIDANLTKVKTVLLRRQKIKRILWYILLAAIAFIAVVCTK